MSTIPPLDQTANTATLTSRIDSMKVSRWHWNLLLLCTLGIMFENFDMTSAALAMPVIAQEWSLKPYMIGVLLSGSSLGMLIGAPIFGILTDVIGRKKSFIITTILYSVFVGLSAFAADFTQLYIVRVLAGIGLGGFIPVASAYVSEFAPTRVRGRFMGLFTVGNGIGYILAVVASMLLVSNLQQGWRYVFAFGALGIFVLPFVHKMLPESVRWLQGKGRTEAAVHTVEDIEQKVFGHATVPYEMALASAQQAHQVMQQRGKVKMRTLFTKDLLKVSIVAAILWFISSYTFYGFIQWLPTFLTKNMGYTLASGYTFTLIAAIVGTGTPGILVGLASDAFGRRLAVSLCMAIYAIAGFFFLWFGGWWILPLYWFSSAMTSSLYIYSPELFPTSLRGTGLGFASSIGRLAGFVAPMLIGLTVQGYGLGGVFTVNALFLFAGVLVIWLLGVETKNRTF